MIPLQEGVSLETSIREGQVMGESVEEEDL